MLDDFDFSDFWDDSDYARENYVEEPVTPDLLGAAEKELGFRLPAAYVALMRSQDVRRLHLRLPVRGARHGDARLPGVRTGGRAGGH